MADIPLKHIIFIDIETVSIAKNYNDLPLDMQAHWTHKMRFELAQSPEHSSESLYQQRAAIFAEFGKIICISIGMLTPDESQFKIKSYSNHDESELLKDFHKFCISVEKLKGHYIFCGHNIREFDIPYICRRMLINGIKLPNILNIQDKKPWDIVMIDTLQLWKFGDYKHFVSLDLLTSIFGIDSPKDGMDGSKVGEAYWSNHSIQSIVEYCERDIVAVFDLYRKMNQLPLFDRNHILKV